tara:strand:- start:1810 stop:1959 length:150 start_codon:yes stop_codon:yes gene_type:complete
MGSWLLFTGAAKVHICQADRAMCQWLHGQWAGSTVLYRAKAVRELLTPI